MPQCYQDGYITPTSLGFPNAHHRGETRKWLLCPDLLGGFPLLNMLNKAKSRQDDYIIHIPLAFLGFPVLGMGPKSGKMAT